MNCSRSWPPLVSNIDVSEEKIASFSEVRKEYQSGSSQYASADSSFGSNQSISVQQMSLGLPGTQYLQDREVQVKAEPQPTNKMAHMQTINTVPNQMQSFFNAAIKRFLGEQKMADQDGSRQPRSHPAPVAPNIPDVEMESVGSRHSQTEEYDPDDLWASEPRHLQVAMAKSNANMGTVIQRLRVFAISELTEFSGNYNDEDRARSWIWKVKSAFLRDQASERKNVYYSAS